MKRRRLLFASAAVASLPRVVAAQPRVARIGWLTAQRPPSLTPYVAAFRDSLAELGFVDGKNLTIEFRYGDDDLGKVRALADELVRLPVDVIVVQGEAVLELRSLRMPVPVVYAYCGDPVAAGLAESLARPNANMTGLTYLALELNGKREPDAVISLFADSFTVQNRGRIVDFALRERLPLVSSWPVFANAGALCTYGPRLADSYKRLAYYVDRVLRGTKPADLPIELPTTIETIVNLKTADAIGLQVPQAVLVRADQVLR